MFSIINSVYKGSDGSTYYYYVCQRDVIRQNRRSTTSRNLKGVAKHEFCPARIYVRKIILPSDELEIQVSYCDIHSHNPEFKDTRHHRLPRGMVKNLENLVHMGVPTRIIREQYEAPLKQVQNLNEIDWCVDSYIPNRKIDNIRQKIKKLNLRYPDEGTAVNMFVQENRSSIFVYKPQGQEHAEIGNLNLDHLIDKKAEARDQKKEIVDTFILGIQSERMRKVMAEGIHRCLSIDEKHNTNLQKFVLLNFIVPSSENYTQWDIFLPIEWTKILSSVFLKFSKQKIRKCTSY